MAIQKSKTLINGTTGNYWKITSITVDKQKMVATCVISLFLSSAKSNSVPMARGRAYKVAVTKEQLAGDITAVCYTSLKTQAAKLIRGQPTDSDIAGGIDV